MKKVASIIAVALIALGAIATQTDNLVLNFDVETLLACWDCWQIEIDTSLACWDCWQIVETKTSLA